MADDIYGFPTSIMVRPLLGLFYGESGGRKFKMRLSAEWEGNKGKIGIRELMDRALEEIPIWVLDAR